ncbi:MAG: acyl-CoA reductase, partial [Akkermansiaceae bacterium]|nr:acyl-CoA reductase [Akkermansiaceae bacterium]
FDPEDVPFLDLELGATRFCALGETQNPSLFWHHDGLPPLASLVTWIDLG